jgi:hypothetical protein
MRPCSRSTEITLYYIHRRGVFGYDRDVLPRLILTEVYLCHACSCHEMLSTEATRRPQVLSRCACTCLGTATQ